jgi:hypothetical protein
MSVHGPLVLNELERFNIGALLAEEPLSISLKQAKGIVSNSASCSLLQEQTSEQETSAAVCAIDVSTSLVALQGWKHCPQTGHRRRIERP